MIKQTNTRLYERRMLIQGESLTCFAIS